MTQIENLTEYQTAVMHLAHFELQYHRLKSAAQAVLSSERPLSNAQSAVLTGLLEELAAIVEEPTPQWGRKPTAEGLAALTHDALSS